FQDMAVLGSVYGFVDCVVRCGSEVLAKYGSSKQAGGNAGHTSFSSNKSSFDSILETASDVGLELIEAPRALPVLDEDDYRRIRYYVQNFHQQKNRMDHSGGVLAKLSSGKSSHSKREVVMVTEIISPYKWQRYENKKLVSEGVNPLGLVPVVHIQNVAQPYYYEGISDVEQLVGLQDELNTRLSDRANRITFQAFKMYLAKGIDGIDDKPIAPGRMWCTDNVEASIDQFGGDGNSPSENMHISEIREAMDKISGVTPVVAGVLKNKIGNLTSGVALKMTFMGMLSKTSRKQFTYGRGLRQIARMVLGALDVCGVYPTRPDERDIDVVFANPLPEDTLEKLQQAQIKKELGVSEDDILKEIGY
ncbi:MAG: phage portal protein, partial [Anaerohalosphaera sp.]|nr:phage portal protein [Anaerohalosphaera sp.]